MFTLEYNGVNKSVLEKTDISTSSTTNSSTKVPCSSITYTLQNSVNTLNTKMSKVPYMIAGTKSATATGNSMRMHTTAELATLFNQKYSGIKTFASADFTAANCSAAYSNGDGVANSSHIDGATYQDSIWWAVFDRSTYTAIRINYIYVYFE